MSCKIKCILVLFFCVCQFSAIASQDPSKILNNSLDNKLSTTENETRNIVGKPKLEIEKTSTSALFSSNKVINAQNADKNYASADFLKDTKENVTQKPVKEVKKEKMIEPKRKLIKKSQARQKSNEAHMGEGKCFENRKLNNDSSKKIEGNIPPVELCSRPRSQRVEKSVISTTPPLDQKETETNKTEIVMRTPGEIDILRRMELWERRSERHFQCVYQQLEQIKQEHISNTKLLEYLKDIEQQQYITAKLLQKLHKNKKSNKGAEADKKEGREQSKQK